MVIVANEDEVLGSKATARQAYVGQDFVASGYRIGKHMVEQHGLGEGDFCVTPVEEPDLIYGQKRYEGTKMALDEAGVASELIGTGPVMETALTIIAEYLLANPETDCVISLGLTPMSVAPLAIEEAGLGSLPNGGFDVGPEVVEYIKGRHYNGRHGPAGLLAGLHASALHRHGDALRARAGGLRHRRRYDHQGKRPPRRAVDR